MDLQDRQNSLQKICFSILILIVIGWGLVSCSDRIDASQLSSVQKAIEPLKTGKLAEVPPPSTIEQLKQILDQYQPQVSILTPKADQVFSDTTVEVQLQVNDLPVFKDENLEMGPHIHLILDNEPYQSVYDLEKPVRLENLKPGTHTLRAFAVRPWHESFKNEEAYAQISFHIFTRSEDNHPNSELPLLTYSRPQGNYGAEPIMLDFYLTNAPLHLVAQENPEDEIKDWRIRVTINGESFLMDNWQTVYLQGFDTGENWIKLEFLDEQGELVKNAFNNTVRVITYQPGGEDSLSLLMRGELSLEEAKAMVIPDYQYQPLVESPPMETEEEIPSPEEPETITSEEIEDTETSTPDSTVEIETEIIETTDTPVTETETQTDEEISPTETTSVDENVTNEVETLPEVEEDVLPLTMDN